MLSVQYYGISGAFNLYVLRCPWVLGSYSSYGSKRNTGTKHGNQGNHRKRRSRITIGETLVKVQTQHFCDSLYEEPTLSWCADVFLFFGVCSNCSYNF